jgi:uncharacterized protein (TIGR02246 family)
VSQLSEIDRQAIRQARGVRSAAIAANDPKLAASIVTDDSVILPPGAPARQGRAAIEEWFAAFPAAAIEFDEVEIRGSGDLAYDRGTYVATLRDSRKIKDSRKMRGKYLWIWRQQLSGQWQLEAAMWNSDA